MKEILTTLFEHKTLTRDVAREVLKNIAGGKYNNSEIAAFISVYIMRNITVDELSGFRDALLELCIPMDFSEYDTIDMCGTGGDGKDTFNISTIASFVVAGAGKKVAKHGNYGVSSSCGSSNVMEYLGYKFTGDAGKLRLQIEKAGICFLHAPLFNPAMKNVAPVRKELGIKTFFNMLGPMVNPSSPAKQMVGVFSLELARLYNYLYQESGKSYFIVHNLDGYDEISLTDEFKIVGNDTEMIIAPDKIGFQKIDPSKILGGKDVPESATIFMKVLKGEGTREQNDVVIANAAVGLQCYHPYAALEECISMARESLESKKALDVFNQLMKLQP
ncbi:MAG: anthranilate phosphoribosyltransferase [Bacteroidales bacterium]